MKNIFIEKLKNVNIIISFIILLFGFSGQLIYGFVWKAKVDDEMKLLKSKAVTLESSNVNDHEKIIEISINLKNLMEFNGIKYINYNK